jgi:hypothetical protein
MLSSYTFPLWSYSHAQIGGHNGKIEGYTPIAHTYIQVGQQTLLIVRNFPSCISSLEFVKQKCKAMRQVYIIFVIVIFEEVSALLGYNAKPTLKCTSFVKNHVTFILLMLPLWIELGFSGRFEVKYNYTWDVWLGFAIRQAENISSHVFLKSPSWQSQNDARWRELQGLVILFAYLCNRFPVLAIYRPRITLMELSSEDFPQMRHIQQKVVQIWQHDPNSNVFCYFLFSFFKDEKISFLIRCWRTNPNDLI